MNLMKLLTVGRSLNGGKPVSGHYKVQQILLPKFASSVRPSRTAIAARKMAISQKVEAGPTPVAANVGAPAIERSIDSSPGMDKTQKIPAGKVLKRTEPKKFSLSVRIIALIQKQIAAVKKRLFPVRSKKKSGVIATQAEWNLEKVTVARNDLSEADLEIVTPKGLAAAPSQKVHFPDLGRVKDSGRAWIKMTSRWFKPRSPFAVAAEEQAEVAQPENADRRELAERT
jgi:hypothetical protein